MKRIDKQAMQITGALLISVLFAACSGDMDDLERYIIAVKARPVDLIPPIPATKYHPPYTYEGLTGRSPFRQSASESDDETHSRGGLGPQPNLGRVREYLERYALDTLSMVGTFSKEESYWALVRDPEGVIHRLPTGGYLGKNHGQVIWIQNSKVNINELISDGMGGWQVREASIALADG